MKFSTILAFAGAAVAALEKRGSVDPASASLALFAVLPASIQSVALTNPSAAATIIESQFATGTPTWFTKLATDVQTYFLTAAAAAIPTSTPVATHNGTTKASNYTMLVSTTKAANSSALSYTSSTITSKASSASASASASAAGTTTKAASSSSSSAGAAASQVIGAGLAGALGLVGLLAL